MLSVRACGRVIFAASLLGIAGCRTPFPFANDPYSYNGLSNGPSASIVSDAKDLGYIETRLDEIRMYVGRASTEYNFRARNEFLTLKMYLVDKAYFEYERQLYNEDVGLNSIGAIGALGSNIVATAIPVGQATKALSAVAAGLTGATSLYDQKVLLTQTIQALQVQMRTNRDKQAATIYSRMVCTPDVYNIGMALSDIEVYARAGTIEAALQGLNKTVAEAHTAAKDTKDNLAVGGGTKSESELKAALRKVSDALDALPKCPLGDDFLARSKKPKPAPKMAPLPG